MTQPLFEYCFTLRLGDTDAAGVIYFAHLLERSHEAYEAWLDSAGMPLRVWLEQGPALPIVHAEADFLAPAGLGQELRVSLQLEKLGRSSFTLAYEFKDAEERCLARARTVHVAMRQNDAVPLPPALRAKLEKRPST